MPLGVPHGKSLSQNRLPLTPLGTFDTITAKISKSENTRQECTCTYQIYGVRHGTLEKYEISLSFAKVGTIASHYVLYEPSLSFAMVGTQLRDGRYTLGYAHAPAKFTAYAM